MSYLEFPKDRELYKVAGTQHSLHVWFAKIVKRKD